MVGTKEDREVGMVIFIEKYDNKAGLPVNTAVRPPDNHYFDHEFFRCFGLL